MKSRGSSDGAEAFTLLVVDRCGFGNGRTDRLSLPRLAVVLLALAPLCAAPAFAGETACCDLLTGTCFDDDPAINDKVCTDTDLGGATTCYNDCACPALADCAVCMSKQAGNLAEFEFQLVGGAGVFDGTNTTFTYQICGLGGAGLSHFIMDLSPDCCLGIVATSGGDCTGADCECGFDGSTGFDGLKFNMSGAPPPCDGLCGGTGDLFSVTLAGNVPTGSCLKILNKADGFEDTSTGCILGPNCSACPDGTCDPNEDCSTCPDDCPLTCDDGVDCTNPICDPLDSSADARGCVNVANDGKCEDGSACTTDTCDPDDPFAGIDGCVFTCPALSITCPTDREFECDNVGAFGTVTTSGGCGAVTIQDPVVNEILGCGLTETITRTFTAVDECDTEVMCVQTIEIVDTTPPTCPSNFAIECDETIPPPTATDNCGAATISNLEESSVPGACPNEETITRTFDATDACGLTAMCVQTVEVVDTEPPVVTCPADVTVECNENPFLGEPIVSDNCSADPIVTLTVIEIPGDCDPAGSGGVAGISSPPKKILQREFTVSDAALLSAVATTEGETCGNEVTCTQIVTVIDTIPPVVTACPGNTTIACGESFEFDIPTTDGSCDGTLDIECTFSDTATPDAFSVTELTGGGFRVTVTDTTTVSVSCTSTDECANVSDACAFGVSTTCPRCGDGVVNQPSEQCDTSGVTTSTCDRDCTFPECGDGFLNRAAGEECDFVGPGCVDCHPVVIVPAVSEWGLLALVLVFMTALTVVFGRGNGRRDLS